MSSAFAGINGRHERVLIGLMSASAPRDSQELQARRTVKKRKDKTAPSRRSPRLKAERTCRAQRQRGAQALSAALQKTRLGTRERPGSSCNS